MCLGDALRDMGFYTTRADPDLRVKKSSYYYGYDYLLSFVEDLIVVSKNQLAYLDEL